MVEIVGIDGSGDGEINLPLQFQERVRPDIMKKAVLSAQSKRRQPYGADERSGLKHVTYWKKRNNAYRGIRGKSYPSSRTPRKITMRQGMQMSGPGGEAPQAVGGRKAHPPKADKDFSKDINEKERRKAIRSAIAATTKPETVSERGHAIDGVDIPLVVDSSVEAMDSTADVVDLLQTLGLSSELERIQVPKRNAGSGRMRGRKQSYRVGPLFVYSEDSGITQGSSNIPGVEACRVDHLNAEILAPGTEPGRLTIWSENAVKQLGDEELFR